jgi:hypothetical protein
VPDHVRRAQLERVEELLDVACQVNCGITVRAWCRTAHAPQIHGNDRELLRQARHDPPPRIPVFGKAVQQHQSGAVAAPYVVDRCPVDACCLGDETALRVRHCRVDRLAVYDVRWDGVRSSGRPASSRDHWGMGRPSGHTGTGVQFGGPLAVRVMEHRCGQPGGESSHGS